MIISEKYKYVFVGIPFSGSSAISKELVEFYDGKKIYKKHTNIQMFLNDKRYKSDEYFIFGVYRDPFSILKVNYSKYLFNANEVYTNPKFLVKNGGHVTQNAVKTYNKIHNENLSFLDFLKMKCTFFIPFDFVFSINEKHLNYCINFNNLSEEFNIVLSKIGLEKKRDLPVHNKTRRKVEIKFKKEFEDYYLPYLNRNSDYKHLNFNLMIRRIIYDIVRIFRKIKWLKRDKLSPSLQDKDY